MARTRSTSASKPRAAAKPKAAEPNVEKLGEAAEPKTESEAPKEKKQRAVSDENQAVIERMRVMYEDEGLGFPSIANTLNAEGVKPFGKGVKWYPPVVRGICLRNGWMKGEKKATDKAA